MSTRPFPGGWACTSSGGMPSALRAVSVEGLFWTPIPCAYNAFFDILLRSWAEPEIKITIRTMNFVTCSICISVSWNHDRELVAAKR